MQKYNTVLHRMVSGYRINGKKIISKQRMINGKSIFGIITGYTKKRIGDNPIAPINNKFLFPSPNAKAGETASNIMNTFVKVFEYEHNSFICLSKQYGVNFTR